MTKNDRLDMYPLYRYAASKFEKNYRMERLLDLWLLVSQVFVVDGQLFFTLWITWIAG